MKLKLSISFTQSLPFDKSPINLGFFSWKKYTEFIHFDPNFNYLCVFSALFGGMMGCAVGMSLASVCELIYWIILKPVTKLLIIKNVTISAKWKPYYTSSFFVIFFIMNIFIFFQFSNVYTAYQNRSFHWVQFHKKLQKFHLMYYIESYFGLLDKRQFW